MEEVIGYFDFGLPTRNVRVEMTDDGTFRCKEEPRMATIADAASEDFASKPWRPFTTQRRLVECAKIMGVEATVLIAEPATKGEL